MRQRGDLSARVTIRGRVLARVRKLDIRPMFDSCSEFVSDSEYVLDAGAADYSIGPPMTST